MLKGYGSVKAKPRKSPRLVGLIAAPDVIHWAPGLPKTRSGKIMRRILRKIAENEVHAVGDTSTLADPSVIEDLLRNRKDD
jgi:acetyl-CoA synthetase